jgi:hypothetical protein
MSDNVCEPADLIAMLDQKPRPLSLVPEALDRAMAWKGTVLTPRHAQFILDRELA